MSKELNSGACMVYDLVEYKLKKFIDSYSCGSEEWDVGMNLMLLYLDNEVTIKWSNEGIIISPTDKKVPEGTELLIPIPTGND